MRVAIIGAGPAGLFTGAGLARRGHEVIAVERDPGPAADGSWPRRGVMQFHHAHGFRFQVEQALAQEVPDALQRWLAAGAEPFRLRLPDGSEIPMGIRSRRQTFERALRDAALNVPGLRLRQGHAEAVTEKRGRAAGLLVDGVELPADLVIDASGRAGRATRSLRPAPVSGGPCGIAYVDRQYQLRPGAEPGPLLNPLAWQADLDGYQTIVFLQERGVFSVLLARPANDPVLAQLRHEVAFEAAARAIPGLADWIDPARARPITSVLPGGPLLNAYRGQTGSDGRLALPGLVFVGDAVATTTPTFGRGVAITLLQAQQLLRLVDEHGTDAEAIGEGFDAWCAEQIKPWVDDHVHMDEATRRRWAGQDLDLSQPLPSDLILAAAETDPATRPAIGGYLSMTAPPSSLRVLEPRARALYATGWRPRLAPGPTRDELACIIQAALRTFPSAAA
jgi:2-polyprenyl-6-methoxyphenol hydroxylase-like FAD-dependent oxidoreductase